jgi:hypothetical protein
LVPVQVVVWAGGAGGVLSVAARPSDDDGPPSALRRRRPLVVVFFLRYFFIIMLLTIRLIAVITNLASFMIVISILFILRLVINVLMVPTWPERRFRTPNIVIHSYTCAPQVLHAFGNALGAGYGRAFPSG